MKVKITPEMLSEIMDMLVEGKSADTVAKLMTRKHRLQFTRCMIIGKVHREFGGIKEFLTNYIEECEDDEKSIELKRVLKHHYKHTI